MKNMVWGIAPVKGRLLKPFLDKRNRPRIQLNKKKYFVSTLVASYFLKKPENIKNIVVNHIDNDPSNNSVDNLEWVSQKENIAHSIRQGRHSTIKRWENHVNVTKKIRMNI